MDLTLEYCYPQHMLQGLSAVLCFFPACNMFNSEWIHLQLIHASSNLAAPVFPLIC
jgi:hypothetical protein